MTTVSAQSWADLYEDGNATYVGGFYAAVSYACLGTSYTNDSGYWASGDATIQYQKGCARAIYDAMFGDVETPVGYNAANASLTRHERTMFLETDDGTDYLNMADHKGDFDILHYNVGKS